MKSSLYCPYCNNEIQVEYSKVKDTRRKKKKEPTILKVKTMNDYASIMKVKNMDDLVIAGLTYSCFVKNIEKMPYSDLFKTIKMANKYFPKMMGSTKVSISRLTKGEKILEHPNNTYSLAKKEIKRIGKEIKKHL